MVQYIKLSKVITVNLHTNDMSTGQLGSPFVLIVIKCDTASFFGQLDVIIQCLETAASTVRSLCEHQRLHVVEVVFFHQLATVSIDVQRLAYKIEDSRVVKLKVKVVYSC